MQKKTKKRLAVLALVLAVLAALIFAAFCRGLTISRYAVSSPKLHNQEPIRAVLLTDLLQLHL